MKKRSVRFLPEKKQTGGKRGGGKTPEKGLRVTGTLLFHQWRRENRRPSWRKKGEGTSLSQEGAETS